MSVGTLISVEEYLNTAYDPDVEYLDGVLVERNVGDWLHSTVQGNCYFSLRSKYPRAYVRVELRSQTTATRYRLPDVCVVLTPPRTKYLIDAAYIAIEILSEDDSMSKVIEKLREYESKGVRNIWLIDPRLRTMSVYTAGDLREIREDRIATSTEPHIELTREELFNDLDPSCL